MGPQPQPNPHFPHTFRREVRSGPPPHTELPSYGMGMLREVGGGRGPPLSRGVRPPKRAPAPLNGAPALLAQAAALLAQAPALLAQAAALD